MTVSTEPGTAATIPADPSTQAGRAPDILTGQLWGDFLIGTLLGRGGMGAVYRGRQRSLDRDVAIKVLPPHLSDNEGFRSRFQLEAKAVASLDSPHIIKVYGAGEASGHHYFAMEYVEGDDLAVTVRKNGKPAQRLALEWVLQAARGLQAAGELGIVHRDIKPANMMLTRRGIVKLMDFGLVRSTKENHGLTMTGTVMGTVSYFSPEQGRGERCDSRTDLYALGVVLYEFLTGRLPFTGEDPTSIIYQHIHVAPIPPREIDPEIPEDFQAVCLKCLQKDADHRYQDAGELVADLERLSRGDHPAINAAELERLRHGTTMYVSSRRPSSSRRLAPWILAATVVSIAAAVAVWLTRQPTVRETPLASQPLPTRQVAPVAPIVTATSLPPATMPVAQPAAVVIVPSIVVPVGSVWAPKVQELVAASRFAEARALVAAHPEDPALNNLGRAIDQTEGATSLARCRAALQIGDLAAAAIAVEAARTVLGAGSVETIDLAHEVDQRSTQVRGLLLTARSEAAAGRIAEAQIAVGKARAIAPTFANVAETETVVQREADRLAQVLAARDTARVSGEQALTALDLDAAERAFAEALRLDPTDAGAAAGQRAVAAKKVALAGLAQRVTAAVQAKDLNAAKRALELLTADAPALAMTSAASAQVAGLEREIAAAKAAAEALEATRVAAAAALLTRTSDLRVPVARLEADLADFLGAAGADRVEGPAISQRIEDRRQRDAFASRLTQLDAAVLGAKADVISGIVADADLAKAFSDLGGQEGLVFASRLTEFKRQGDTASATVSLRHALTSFPEITLTYQYDLVRKPAGWTITAGRRLE